MKISNENDRQRRLWEIHKGTEIKNVVNDLKVAEQVVDFAGHAFVGHASVVTEQGVVVVGKGAEASAATHRSVEA